MKKFAVLMIIFLFLLGINSSFAYYTRISPVMRGNARINTGLNYNNPVRTNPQANAINRVVITTDRMENFVTPLPPPPPRHKYHYKDFAGEKRFANRSYYIPSYCMPGAGFHSNIYNDMYNPFCNHYRPFGSNMYISF